MRKHYVTLKSVRAHFAQAAPVGIYVERRGYTIILKDSLGKKTRITADNSWFAKLVMEIIDDIAAGTNGALDLADGVQAWINWMVREGIVPESARRIRKLQRISTGVPEIDALLTDHGLPPGSIQ